MRSRCVIFFVLVVAAAASIISADDQGVDKVTKQATQLEAELTKLRSTSGEAAEVMLKLTDLYYQEGRVFGLIRIGQNFVALHTSHPKHKDVMLKLMDGLLVTGRNKEVIATSRQFLVRYPKDPACVEVERRLAELLTRGGETAAAAAVNESRWRRLGQTPEGVTAGMNALGQFTALNNADGFARAATLGDDLLEKLPAGPVATAAGWRAFDGWERGNNWAKANLTASKLLQKSPPADPWYLRELHRRMGENYSRVGQRANAIDSYRKAMAVPGLAPRADINGRLINELHQTRPKPAELEPLVSDYLQKFPTRDDRHSMRIVLAVTYLAAGDKDKAEQILAEVLPFDSRSHNSIGYYTQLFPAEPTRAGKAEQVLRDAIAKSTPYNTVPLRYHLAMDIYRDRLKDAVKARAAAREFVYQYPVNEHYTANLVGWLLDTAGSDDDFKAEFTKLLAVRKQHPYWEFHRNILPGWVTTNAGKKQVEKRVEFAKTALVDADKDPVFADWIALEKASRENNLGQVVALRTKLLAPESSAKLADDVVNHLFANQQNYYRNQAPSGQQPMSLDVARAWTKRLPKSEHAAHSYLYSTTDFNSAKDYREAAQHLLTFEPSHSSDIHRRLMQMAAGTKDVELGKRCWAWIQKAQEKFGYDPNQSSGMGDYLESLGLKDEALASWKRGLVGYETYDCRICFDRITARTKDAAEKAKLLDEMLTHDGYWRFNFAMLKADALLKAGDLDGFEKLLREAAQRQRERPFGGWNPDHDWELGIRWVNHYRNDKKATPADRRRVFTVLRDLKLRMSEVAALALLEQGEEKQTPMQRLLALNAATRISGGDTTDWDQMFPYAQGAMTRKDYTAASALVGGMLANCRNIDEVRRKAGRDMVTQAYSRMGAAGAAIDDKSPVAPLLQAALHLRLGDQKLAFDTYLANQKVFDTHRAEVPVDLLTFVCESHIASGGDENFNRVEDILRAWIIKNSEAKEIDDVEKARVQLLLARNYFRAKRYDLARAEFTTVLNRYAKTPQVVEAEFGIGETYMEQKVYDQAERAFERLASSRERDIVIRAEFLRGVLAGRRGDRDEARAIFRNVLERVPTSELANQVLYNLSEVYGAEQRYVDQLELLRTIGRLGRISKRWHTPGEPLSIVVQDSDLGVSRGHTRIPVRVTTEPGGDEEIIYLRSGGAGKGLFRADLETRLGKAAKGDKVLQLTGNDVIRCDYPDEFKKEFRDVPLPDAEIRVAADARFEMASGKIIDLDEENFTKKLEREAKGDDEDARKSIGRPTTQIKPGNLIYLRVKDADRDLTDQPDTITVKLTATSGDQVTATLTETGPHTGIFEGTVKTGELPAGALATNTALDHSPLMAIDRDPKTYWISEPDGITPKILTIDMKDLKRVDKVTISTPDPKQHAPVRGTLEGSNDGRIWFRLAANPAPTALPVAGEFGRMTTRVFADQNGAAFTTWDQVVALNKNIKPTEPSVAERLSWTRPADSPKVPVSVIWQGKLVQRRPGAVRIQVAGDTTALAVDGSLELPVGKGGRPADLWLEAGTHELTIFAAAGPQTQRLEALWARGDASTTQELPLLAFKDADFDLTQAEAKPAPARKAAQVTVKDADWEFLFAPVDVRYVRLVIHEFRGEAVAINHVVVADSVKNKIHIPTETDLLALATNDILEMAGGDVVTASYIDEFNLTGNSRLLTAQLTATYHNATIVPIAYDFLKTPSGAVLTQRKQLLRIDPGERFIIEVTDFDMDRTAKPDEIKVSVSVNDGPAVELTATETGDNTGVFTKEVDTSTKAKPGALVVKRGDRIYCRYLDEQNTVPGHAVPRETIVYVAEPTEAKLRILETRILRARDEKLPPQIIYVPPSKERKIAGVAFEAPLTVEVIDPDAAKDARSSVIVQLTTTDGAKVEVECLLADVVLGQDGPVKPGSALEEGRFVGQVILQLGGKDSPSVLPLTLNMPRNLIGRPVFPKEANIPPNETSLITQVLNLTGKDVITATYTDAQRPQGPAVKLTAQGRMMTDGKLTCTDSEYQKELNTVHVGERLYLKVVDADLDRSNERDKAKVVITSKRGEKEMVELLETSAHSGIFTGSVMLKPEEKPTPNNLKPTDPTIETWFGDELTILYVDELATTPSGTMECKLTVQVVIGTDGKLSAFSKAFADEALAVETQFHIAESHFELFKSHKTLEREAESKADLEAGRRVLRGVMDDYPNPKYVPRVSYLLGQFSQELKQWSEAIESYQLIIKQYPEHALAADAQFKLAQCYEESGDFNQALDAYVTLAATYPKSPLIANVMVRISEHFFKAENYKVAAQVGEKFLERFEGHKWGPKMAFRLGQCYHKDKQYKKAAEAFDRFNKTFPDDALAADSLFWAGESYRLGNNPRKAFQRYNDCRFNHQESEAAKYARGRLALPEMLRQFEEATNLDNK
jgi:TolA-binding protein